MRLIFTGSQGTGKSTLNDIISKKYPELKVHDSISNKFFNKETFKNIFSEEYKEAQKNIYDYASEIGLQDNYISSRGFPDSYAYLTHSYEKTKDVDYLDILERNVINQKTLNDSEELTIFFYVPIEFENESKELRSANMEFQMEVDANILKFLHDTDTRYYTIRGSIDERVQEITRIIEGLT